MEVILFYLHDSIFIVLCYIICKHNNYNNKLSPSEICFDLYRSSSG
jgi:hypothetical protein